MNGDEIVRLNQMLDAVGAGSIGRIPVTLPGNPYSKSRPRFRVIGKGRNQFVQTYSAPDDVTAEKVTAAGLRLRLPTPMTGNVAMAAVFYRATRQPVDVDNLLKHVGDSANGVVWLDDSQSTAMQGVIELDADYPRTVLMFARHYTTMLRGSDAFKPCRACGELFPLEGSAIARQYCGTACAGMGRRKDFVPFKVTS